MANYNYKIEYETSVEDGHLLEEEEFRSYEELIKYLGYFVSMSSSINIYQKINGEYKPIRHIETKNIVG